MDCQSRLIYFCFSCLSRIGIRNYLVRRFAFFPPSKPSYVFRQILSEDPNYQPPLRSESMQLGAQSQKPSKSFNGEESGFRFHRISSVITEQDKRPYIVTNIRAEEIAEIASEEKQVKTLNESKPDVELHQPLNMASYEIKLVTKKKQAINLIPPDDISFQGYYLETAMGHTIPCIHLQLTKSQSDYIILHSHGNSSDLGVQLDSYLDLCYNLNVDVVGYDYPGFGQSTGQVDDQAAIQAAETAYNFIVKDLKYDSTKIILYGQSIGSGPSVNLASNYLVTIGGLIIHSGFLSGIQVICPNAPPTYQDIFPNIEYIKYINCPVLIIHGTDDKQISFKQAKELSRETKKLHQLWLVREGGHNDIELDDKFREEYFQTLRHYFRKIAEGQNGQLRETIQQQNRSSPLPQNFNHLYQKNVSIITENDQLPLQKDQFSPQKNQQTLQNSKNQESPQKIQNAHRTSQPPFRQSLNCSSSKLELQIGVLTQTVQFKIQMTLYKNFVQIREHNLNVEMMFQCEIPLFVRMHIQQMSFLLIDNIFKFFKHISNNEYEVQSSLYSHHFHCFCKQNINLTESALREHILKCKPYQQESPFYHDFLKLPLKQFKDVHLMALKSEFLNFIDLIDEELRIKSPKAKVSTQNLLIQNSVQDPIITSLFKQKNKAFCQGCAIKYDLPSEDMITLSGCNHSYCKRCLEKQISRDYSNLSGKITCRRCKSAMNQSEIKIALGSQIYDSLVEELSTGIQSLQDELKLIERMEQNKKCLYCYEDLKDNPCQNSDCQVKIKVSCKIILECGHQCCGFFDEPKCQPCMKCNEQIDLEVQCAICYSETLSQAPCIVSQCGHIFHYSCIVKCLQFKWSTPDITFSFCLCALCKTWLEFHSSSDPQHTIEQFHKLKMVLQSKALLHLTKEGNQLRLSSDQQDKQQLQMQNQNQEQFQEQFQQNQIDPGEYALSLYCYYQCCRCKQPYFGGTKDCQRMADSSQLKAEYLICPDCAHCEKCSEHGTEFILYKCRFCCNRSLYFCWGTTNFCEDCHQKQCKGDYLNRKTRDKLPKCLGIDQCVIGGQHRPNGEEQALGCSLCKNLQ